MSLGLIGALAGGVVAVCLTFAVLSSMRTASRVCRPPTRARRDTSRMMTALGRAGLPPWAAMGSRFAGERGTRGIPGRAAIGGAVAGVAGVVAVMAFGAAMHATTTQPGRYGWGDWDAIVNIPDADGLQRLSSDPAVSTLAEVNVRAPLHLNDHLVGGLVLNHLVGTGFPTIVAGRAPRANTEIALGSATAADLGVHVGDVVHAATGDGSGNLHIVGLAAFPAGDDGDSINTGFTLDRAAYRAVGGADDPCSNNDDCFTTYLMGFAHGRSVPVQRARLAASGYEITPPEPGVEVLRLREVQNIPRYLALLLAIVAFLGIVHVLAVTIARRRRELAIMGALGFLRRQTTGVLVAQAGVIGLIGALAGSAIGLVAGRIAWHHAARSVGVPATPAVAAVTVVGVALGFAMVSGLLGVVPGILASRRPAAAGLRESQ